MTTTTPVASGEECTLAPGVEYILTPHGLTIDGKAVARLPLETEPGRPEQEKPGGRVCFIDRALPGQRVRVRIDAVKERFVTAHTLSVLSPAPDQVEPFCPHFSECGGCDWQDLEYSAQLDWKRRFIEDALTRIGKVPSFTVAPVLASPALQRHRNKVEFAFGKATASGGGLPPELHSGLCLGLRRRGTHEIVEIGDCPASDGPVREILAAARTLAAATGLPVWESNTQNSGRNRRGARKSSGMRDKAAGFWRFLVLRVHAARDGQCDTQVHVQLITGPHPDARRIGHDFLHGLHKAVPEITGARHSIRKARANIAYGEQVLTSLDFRASAPSSAASTATPSAGDELQEHLGPVVLKLDPDAFFQTNSLAAERLYAEIARLATGCEAVEADSPGDTGSDGPVVWDIYSGVGGIALTLAGKARCVVGFELSEAACRAAERNCRLNGVENCRFFAGDVAHTFAREDFLRQNSLLANRPDVLVVDPPRAGLELAVLTAVARLRPRRIIHVGCDVGNQARDVGRLLAHGYRVKHVCGVDMFPHTAHVESIVLLETDE